VLSSGGWVPTVLEFNHSEENVLSEVLEDIGRHYGEFGYRLHMILARIHCFVA
jgi:hypothetical protein